MLEWSAETRRGNLTRAAEETFDVLVVGGGITGCGIALDAVARGLSVALVEKEDFAWGTSGRSSRLVHGGLRYIPQGRLGLVREGLRERAVLLRNAPHLVTPRPMYLQTGSLGSRVSSRAGVVLYDLLALGRNPWWHGSFGARDIAHLAPGLGDPRPGVRYAEATTDDARLTLEIARTAHRLGAVTANHAEVRGLLGEGRVTGALVEDRLTGQRLEVRARMTVSATGVWADRIQGMREAPCRVRPSKGVHLVFRPGAVGTRVPLVVPSAGGDRRFVFVIPWAGRVYAGTTDTPYEGDRDRPEIDDADRAYVLAAVAQAFPGVTEADVVAEWAGLRPLLDDAQEATTDLSRRHAIFESPPGLLTITGGKLTTYRAMAEEVVDRVATLLGRAVPCPTREIPLGLGAPLEPTLHAAADRAARLGLAPDAGRRLVHRYGDDWIEAARLLADDPSLGTPIVDGLPVLRVELELARSREMAITDDDILVRRTRLTTFDGAAGRALREAAPRD